jgi:CheY-like chemotaxis protein
MTSQHHVLVVDDDRDIRESLVEALEEHGFAAVGAVNGRDALDKLRALARAQRPCLILLDIMMPGMDGTAFREEQLQDPELAPIPVVVLSAYRDVAERAAPMNVSEHLRKPVKLSELVRVTVQHCARAAARGSAPSSAGSQQ